MAPSKPVGKNGYTTTLRCEILSQIFKESKNSDGILEMNCNCNTNDIVNKILLPVLPSVQETRECQCKQTGLPYIPINYDILHRLGFKDLEKSFTFKSTKNIKCTECNKKTKVQFQVNPQIVFIDVQTLQEDNQTVLLTEIQKTISFSSTEYKLKAVIEYQPIDYSSVSRPLSRECGALWPLVLLR